MWSGHSGGHTDGLTLGFQPRPTASVPKVRQELASVKYLGVLDISSQGRGHGLTVLGCALPFWGLDCSTALSTLGTVSFA